MSKLAKLALLSSFAVAAASGSTIALAAPAAKKAPVAKKPAPPVPKKQAVVNEEHKKSLLTLMAGFKFGMTKDEVIAQLGKSLDEKYQEQLKQTQDVAAQDRIRQDRKAEIARISQSYIAFDAKKTGWDVSIVEDEFAHNTNESMIERWENEGGKNQRRFFFFYDGKLWKMFVSLDVSILPEDKQNFETFRAVMEQKYGAGDVDVGLITWHTPEFDARAVDKLKTYGALGLAIQDNSRVNDVMALRKEKAPPKQEENAVIRAVVDTKGDDHPDVKSNGNAIDSVIQSNGGTVKKHTP
jgi:hypothetical protein